MQPDTRLYSVHPLFSQVSVATRVSDAQTMALISRVLIGAAGAVAIGLLGEKQGQLFEKVEIRVPEQALMR